MDDRTPAVRQRRRPSMLLLLSGLLALGLGATSLAGPDTWHGVDSFPFGWVLVVAAIVIGVALLHTPKRS